MKEEQSAFLMIGGPIDGEVYAIPPNTRIWCVPTMEPMHLSYYKDIESIPEAVPYTEHKYHRFTLINKSVYETLAVFVHQDIMEKPNRTYFIMLELLNHYRVIK